MSTERYSPDDYFRDDLENTQLSASMMYEKVDYMIGLLNYRAHTECTNPDDYIELHGECIQLERLRELIYLMAEYKNTDESINLDDKTEQLTLSIDSTTKEPLYDTAAETAFAKGVIRGTDTFLALLAHGDIPAEGTQVTDDSFSPRDIRLPGKTPKSRVRFVDQSVNVTYKTCVPGIEIDYYYPPGALTPYRTIYFRDEDGQDRFEAGIPKERSMPEAIRNNIDSLLLDIEQNRAYDGGVENLGNYCIQEARLKQVEELSERILALTKGRTPDTTADVVDPRLTEKIKDSLRIRLPDDLSAQQKHRLEELESWVDTGMRIGTDDVLEMLVPDTITNEGARAVEFFPWRWDLLEKTGLTTRTDQDGNAEVCYQTKVENLELVLSYTKAERSLPRLLIRKKDPSAVLDKSIRPSPPQ